MFLHPRWPLFPNNSHCGIIIYYLLEAPTRAEKKSKHDDATANMAEAISQSKRLESNRSESRESFPPKQENLPERKQKNCVHRHKFQLNCHAILHWTYGRQNKKKNKKKNERKASKHSVIERRWTLACVLCVEGPSKAAWFGMREKSIKSMNFPFPLIPPTQPTHTHTHTHTHNLRPSCPNECDSFLIQLPFISPASNERTNGPN